MNARLEVSAQERAGRSFFDPTMMSIPTLPAVPGKDFPLAISVDLGSGTAPVFDAVSI